MAKCTLHTVLYVAKELLNQRAMLLPHIANQFLTEYYSDQFTEYQADSMDYTLIGRESSIKFTSKWLLKQLLSYLYQHMDHTCVHKKFGTVLYRKGGDLLTSLSWALGRPTFSNDTAPTTSSSSLTTKDPQRCRTPHQ